MYGEDVFANKLLHVQLAIEDVEETWRDRWTSMDLSERTHFLNVELLDVERYLRELGAACERGALGSEQESRLATLASAWERARLGPIAEMTRSVEQALRSGAA